MSLGGEGQPGRWGVQIRGTPEYIRDAASQPRPAATNTKQKRTSRPIRLHYRPISWTDHPNAMRRCRPKAMHRPRKGFVELQTEKPELAQKRTRENNKPVCRRNETGKRRRFHFDHDWYNCTVIQCQYPA